MTNPSTANRMTNAQARWLPVDQALPMDFMITPRKRISDAVDDAARRPTAPRAPAVLDPIAAIAQACAMSEVAAEIEAEQGIRATCPATPMLSDA